MEHVRPLYPITVELAKQIEEESKRHNGEFDDLATKCMAIAKAQEWVDRTVLINKDELAAIESGIDKHLYELSQLGHHVNVCENLKLKLQQAHNSNSRVAFSREEADIINAISLVKEGLGLLRARVNQIAFSFDVTFTPQDAKRLESFMHKTGKLSDARLETLRELVDRRTEHMRAV